MVYVDEEIAIHFSIHLIYAQFPYRDMSLETLPDKLGQSSRY